MAARKYKFGKLFNKFLKLVLGNYMKLLFDYHISNREVLKSLKPPYIVLANHTNFWDPFLLSMCFPGPVYFVTSDAYFRNPVLKFLLKLVGAIPKTKRISDPGSIRGILEVVKNKGIVGIFPEGNRSWDGKILPLLPPTAKLIKSLGIPIVCVLFKGACLSMPRWSASTRRGRLEMALSKVLDSQELASLSTDEIFEVITNSLQYDEYETQRMRMVFYKGKRKAEHLELFLFTCPKCLRNDQMRSEGDLFGCGACGYQVTYGAEGFFESHSGDLIFDNPRDWNLWQLKQLDRTITDKIKANSALSIFEEQHILLRTGGKTGELSNPSSAGTLSLYSKSLIYCDGNNKELRFPLAEISGVNVQSNNQLELIFNKVLYRFSAVNGLMPAYKFTKAIDGLSAIDAVKINTLEGAHG